MAEPKLQPIGRLVLTYLVSLFWSSLTFFGLVYNVITKGPSTVFYVKKRDKRPQCLDNEEYGEHGFIRCKNQNLRIHYVAKGDKDKPLMLFLHGFPEFWYSWRYQIKEFSNDYRTVAIDMRGYGESDKPVGVSEYYIGKLILDVKETIEYFGYKSCVLVGHDWGGSVAWVFAAAFPDMVDRLITCNIPHPSALRKQLATVRTQQVKSWYIFFFQMPYLPEVYLRSRDLQYVKGVLSGRIMGAPAGCFTDEDIETFKYTFSGAGAFEGPVNYYRAALRYARPTTGSMKISKIPTLMIWGTYDGFLEKEMASMTADYVEDYTIHFIEGVSHWVQQEEPELVNKYIHDFLNRKVSYKETKYQPDLNCPVI